MKHPLRGLPAAALALAALLSSPARADTTNVLGKYYDPQNRNLFTFIATTVKDDGVKLALVGFPVAPGRPPHYATFLSAAEWAKFVALWHDARSRPREGVSPSTTMLATGHYPAEYSDATMMLFLGIDPKGSVRFEVGRSAEPADQWWGSSLKRSDEAGFEQVVTEVSAFFAGR